MDEKMDGVKPLGKEQVKTSVLSAVGIPFLFTHYFFTSKQKHPKKIWSDFSGWGKMQNFESSENHNKRALESSGTRSATQMD